MRMRDEQRHRRSPPLFILHPSSLPSPSRHPPHVHRLGAAELALLLDVLELDALDLLLRHRAGVGELRRKVRLSRVRPAQRVDVLAGRTLALFELPDHAGKGCPFRARFPVRCTLSASSEGFTTETPRRPPTAVRHTTRHSAVLRLILILQPLELRSGHARIG